MRYAVAGSSTYTDEDKVREALSPKVIPCLRMRSGIN